MQEVRKGASTVDTLHDAMWFFIVIPLVTLVTGTCNALSLCIFDLAHWNQFLDIWPTWVLGDLSAILCFTPCILHLWKDLHPDLLPIWGSSRKSGVPGDSTQSERNSQQHREFQDGAVALDIMEEKVTLSSMHSGVALLPQENDGYYHNLACMGLEIEACDPFTRKSTPDREDKQDLQNANEKRWASDVSKVSRYRLSLEKLKSSWNNWVLDRRRKLCSGGERSGALTTGQRPGSSSFEGPACATKDVSRFGHHLCD